jgi:hypothetical protein
LTSFDQGHDQARQIIMDAQLETRGGRQSENFIVQDDE